MDAGAALRDVLAMRQGIWLIVMFGLTACSTGPTNRSFPVTSP